MKMRGLPIHPPGDRPLTLFVELFGAAATASAIAEVMQTGHVGAEYVEYVLRHNADSFPTRIPFVSATTNSTASHSLSPTCPSTTK